MQNALSLSPFVCLVLVASPWSSAGVCKAKCSGTRRSRLGTLGTLHAKKSDQDTSPRLHTVHARKKSCIFTSVQPLYSTRQSGDQGALDRDSLCSP